MKLIVGLGNPGKEYTKSRHNAGFMVLDELAKKIAIAPFTLEKTFKAEITPGIFNNQKLVLAKPQTFMNLSGEAVSKISQFYKIAPEDILIIYDDLDLPLGQIRLRKSGSAGTHNGMKSVVQCLSSTNIPRLRVGIESRGVNAPQQQDTVSFVLQSFLKAEEPLVGESIRKAVSAIEYILEKGLTEGMNKYNSQKEEPKPKVIWEGDLEDDCNALWEGLMLRAEKMNTKQWWWAVYNKDQQTTIESSNDHHEYKKYINGEEARKAAEKAARKYLKTHFGRN